MPTIIRSEAPQDVLAIRQVNELAFAQCDEADLVDRLRQSDADFLSLVADNDGDVVGHILFTPVAIEREEGSVVGMGLAPMAVLPGLQRRGVGSLLITRGLQLLRERECPFVIVIGHEDYYPRFGFEPASRHEVSCQWEGVPDAALMILVLEPNALLGISGVARYRKEFDANVQARYVARASRPTVYRTKLGVRNSGTNVDLAAREPRIQVEQERELTQGSRRWNLCCRHLRKRGTATTSMP
ncbi:MAG: GNAT family N-acetyltransferase [Longimicrobiales bacterium]